MAMAQHEQSGIVAFSIWPSGKVVVIEDLVGGFSTALERAGLDDRFTIQNIGDGSEDGSTHEGFARRTLGDDIEVRGWITGLVQEQSAEGLTLGMSRAQARLAVDRFGELADQIARPFVILIVE